jgi:SH3-like domain-containing protein
MHRTLLRLPLALALSLAVVLAAGSVTAQTPAPSAPANGAANLPRFVSLRSDEVNLRTGPGVRYPVEWVLQRRNMPVEVLAEFENWRKIRDWQGTEGWVHQSMVSGRRYAIVTEQIRAIRRQPDANSPAVARLEPGVVAQILECKDQWCRLDANGFKGWLTRAEFWGAYPNEAVK